jgi:hypothetical protein
LYICVCARAGFATATEMATERVRGATPEAS